MPGFLACCRQYPVARNAEGLIGRTRNYETERLATTATDRRTSRGIAANCRQIGQYFVDLRDYFLVVSVRSSQGLRNMMNTPLLKSSVAENPPGCAG